MADDPGIPELRNQVDSLSKDIAKERDRAATAEARVRTLEARDAFDSAGYAKAHGDLWATSNPQGEIPDEAAIHAFAAQYKLQLVNESAPASTGEGEAAGGAGGAPEGNESDGRESAALMGNAGSRAGVKAQPSSSEEQMSITEWESLSRSDPEAARRAVREGRVALSDSNPWVSAGQVPG